MSLTDEVLLTAYPSFCHRPAFLEVRAFDERVSHSVLCAAPAVLRTLAGLVCPACPARFNFSRCYPCRLFSISVSFSHLLAHFFTSLCSFLCPVFWYLVSLFRSPAPPADHFGRFARFERGARLLFRRRTKTGDTSVGTAESSHGQTRWFGCIRTLYASARHVELRRA